MGENGIEIDKLEVWGEEAPVCMRVKLALERRGQSNPASDRGMIVGVQGRTTYSSVSAQALAERLDDLGPVTEARRYSVLGVLRPAVEAG